MGQLRGCPLSYPSLFAMATSCCHPFPSIPPLPNPHALALILRHYVQSSPHLFDRSSMAKQNLSHRANVICNGSPSRIRMVRRISLGMTTRPRSSIRRTIPVAFMLYLPFLCVFVMLADSTSLCLLWKNMRARVLIISIPQERSCGISSCRMSENIDIQTGIW